VPVKVETFILGPLKTNSYVLRSGGDCWVVDPGMWPRRLVRFLRELAVVPSRILLTHGHGDHIAGIGKLRKAFEGVWLCCPAADTAMLRDVKLNMSGAFGLGIKAPQADELLEPGMLLKLGHESWKVLDTSGHTPGGVSYYCAAEAMVLTGDALFAGSIGRTDIPAASEARLLGNIREHLLSLPDETRIMPGHGQPSTIGAERRTNPFLAGA